MGDRSKSHMQIKFLQIKTARRESCIIITLSICEWRFLQMYVYNYYYDHYFSVCMCMRPCMCVSVGVGVGEGGACICAHQVICYTPPRPLHKLNMMMKQGDTNYEVCCDSYPGYTHFEPTKELQIWRKCTLI